MKALKVSIQSFFVVIRFISLFLVAILANISIFPEMGVDVVQAQASNEFVEENEASISEIDDQPTTPSTLSNSYELSGVDRVIPPEEYYLAPGDAIELILSGRVKAQFIVEVSADGSVSIPNIGMLPAAGLSLQKFRENLAQKIQQVYVNVDHTLNLKRLHYTKTQIYGQIMEPGWYSFPGPVRVSEAIQKAGGLLPNGSQKNIVLNRVDEQTTLTVNLRQILDGNINAFDPYLRPGDSIYVPIMRNSVEVFGQVYRPGLYELSPDETILNLIIQAGGMTISADKRNAYIERDKERIPLDINSLIYSKNQVSTPTLLPGDRIFLGKVSKEVYVVGDVKSPGPFRFDQNWNLLDYIGEAGGALKNADLSSTTIIRGNLDNIEKYSVDVKSLYKGNTTSAPPVILPGDIIVLPSKGQQNYQGYITLILSALSISNYFK